MENEYSLISLGGDLSRRIDLCRSRMNAADYSADNIFQSPDYEWYGDWEGRAMLAMGCLKRFYGVECDSYAACWARLDAALNEQGYFGPVVDADCVNEQQLAGNSWYVRALCTEYEIAPSENLRQRIQKAVRNLYVRNTGLLKNYPLNETAASDCGYAAGALARKVNNWNLSSDSGCIYIALDGLTHAYAVLRDSELKCLIEQLIAQFAATDLSKKNFQTHAFLSGIRGLMRFYDVTRNKSVFALAQDYFEYYRKTSLNYIYENFGVLNSPNGSEGCAVVDAAMLSAAFFKYTHDVKYLELYRKIYVNAIRATQRSNGGLGCDVGVGTHDIDYYASVSEFTEATWCCTMRGGEGMPDFARNLYAVQGDLVIPMLLNDNTVSLFDGAVELQEKTEYPYDGETVFTVRRCDRPFKLRLYFLDGYELDGMCDGETVTVDRPCTVTVRHSGKVRVRTVEGKRGYERGDMILGETLGNTEKCYTVENHKLQPLVSAIDIDIGAMATFRQKLLF